MVDQWGCFFQSTYWGYRINVVSMSHPGIVLGGIFMFIIPWRRLELGSIFFDSSHHHFSQFWLALFISVWVNIHMPKLLAPPKWYFIATNRALFCGFMGCMWLQLSNFSDLSQHFSLVVKPQCLAWLRCSYISFWLGWTRLWIPPSLLSGNDHLFTIKTR